MSKIASKTYFVLLLYISLYILAFIINSTAADTKCSAADNVKWNKNKQKCVRCANCPPGSFRNLTEPYTSRKGQNGDERCLRCRPCPEGTYSENGQGECIRCRVNCTELKREYDGFCSSIQDAKCGSCFSGYEDIYRHTFFPCSPKRSLRNGPTNNRQQSRNPDEKPSYDQVTPTLTGVQNDADNSHGLPGKIVAGICGVAFLLALGSVASVFIWRRLGSVSNHQGSYTSVQGSDLSSGNDIETDAAEDTPTAVKVVEGEHTAVGCESVIPQPASTQQYHGIVYIQLSDRSNLVRFERSTNDICKCRSEQRCHCESYVFPDQKMEKSEEYITVVASKICHDPFPLFRALGLEYPIIYQEDNTRERDPVNISQKNLVINLLNRWIEVQSTPPTLQQLSGALCRADFHSINDILYNMLIGKNSS